MCQSGCCSASATGCTTAVCEVDGQCISELGTGATCVNSCCVGPP
jgi:hypothetical protein